MTRIIEMKGFTGVVAFAHEGNEESEFSVVEKFTSLKELQALISEENCKYLSEKQKRTVVVESVTMGMVAESGKIKGEFMVMQDETYGEVIIGA